MNIRDLINKVDQLDERGPRIPMRGFQGGRPENREFHNVGGNNGMNALAPALAGGALGYALANRGGQGAGGYAMPQQQMPIQQPQMQPSVTTTTDGPAVPIGQPYLDTAHTINYNTPSKPVEKTSDEAEVISKINDLVAQLEKTQVPSAEKPKQASSDKDFDQDASPATTTKPNKQNLAPVDPKVQAMQKAIQQIAKQAGDPDPFPKYGADGRMGKETRDAMAKYPNWAKATQSSNPGFASNAGGAAFGNPNLARQGAKKNAGMPGGSVPTDEGVNLGIANSLVESFGYEPLEEYSLDDLGSDAGDLARGIGNGMTFGFGDNALAGVKSAFGSDTYKQALEKELQNTARAKERSPYLYGGGELAGMVAAPIPGGLIGRGAAKAAQAAGWGAKGVKAAGLGADIAANAGAAYGLGKLKKAHDTSTVGHTADDTVTPESLYKLSSEEITKIQDSLNKGGAHVTVDGKMGPETMQALRDAGVIAESTKTTVAEQMSDMRKLLSALDEDLAGGAEELATRLAGKEAGAAGGTTEKILGKLAKGTEKIEQAPIASVFKDGSGQTWEKVGQGQWKALTKPTEGGTYKVGDVVNAQADKSIYNMLEKEFSATKGKVSDVTKAEPAAAAGKVGSDTEIAAAVANNPEAQQVMATQGKSGLIMWAKANPKKAGYGLLGLLGLVGVAGLVGGGHAQDQNPMPSPTPRPTPGPINTPDRDQNGEPAAPVGLTPEQEELIRQIKELEDYGSQEQGFKDFKWRQTTSHADAIIARYKKDNKQTQSDQNGMPSAPVNVGNVTAHDMDMMSQPQTVAGNTPTTTPTGLPADVPGSVANITQDVTSHPTVYKNDGGAGADSNPELKKESADVELARWLKIARG
jgi:hypothetical protein